MTGMSLQLSRIRALFVKKAIHTWRNRTVTLVQLLLPALFTILGLAADEARPQGKPQPPLTFNLKPFDGTNIPYTDGENAGASATMFTNMYGNQFDSAQTLEYFNLSMVSSNSFSLTRMHI